MVESHDFEFSFLHSSVLSDLFYQPLYVPSPLRRCCYFFLFFLSTIHLVETRLPRPFRIFATILISNRCSFECSKVTYQFELRVVLARSSAMTTVHSASPVGPDGIIRCFCDEPVREFISRTDRNPGRYVWSVVRAKLGADCPYTQQVLQVRY